MDVSNPRVSYKLKTGLIVVTEDPPMFSQHGSCPEKGRWSPHVYFRDLNKAGPKDDLPLLSFLITYRTCPASTTLPKPSLSYIYTYER